MIDSTLSTEDVIRAAVRHANLFSHSAHVARPDGSVRKVRNLGWLLRKAYGSNGELPTHFRIHKPIIPGTGSAVMVAVFEDGTAYATMWQDKTILREWLGRPTFRDIPIDWVDTLPELIKRTEALHPAPRWEEPADATSPRGWLFAEGQETALGHYLAYEDDYRPTHTRFCRDDRPCRDCQPGNVHAVVVDDDQPLMALRPSRWFVTVEEARAWIERYAHI